MTPPPNQPPQSDHPPQSNHPRALKRIGLVSAFPPARQSLNEYGLHLAKGFAARDDVAEVIVLADKPTEPVEELDLELDLGPKISVQRVWAFNKPLSQLRLIRAARRAKVDTLIFNVQTASFGDREIPAATGLMTPAALRLLGSHVGIIAHNLIAGVDLDKTVLKGQRVRQALIRAAGAVVTRAMCAASYITVTLPAFLDSLPKGAKAHLVPHGTFEGAGADTKPSERGLILNTMGKFGTYKRLETLLAAVDLVRQDPRFTDLRLEIGGSDHPATPGYMAALAAERVGDAGVTFLNYVAEEDVPAFFGRARLSIFDYTTTTGSSGVMHQATSNGAVPLFPLIDDFADLARSEGIEGHHYTPGDAQSLAATLTHALENPTQLDAMAHHNLAAANHTPFADVIAFHMGQIPSP